VDGDDVLVVQGPSATFNPTLDLGMIERAKASDPEAAESEWHGGFRSDISAFLDDASIDRAIDHDRPLELLPNSAHHFVAFTDASGGRHDHYTLAIGHRVGESCIIDVLRGTAPPFDPQLVTKSYAQLLKDYRITKVTGDNFAQEWVAATWRESGITYQRSERVRSEIYLECLPTFTRGLIALPDHPRLLRELRLLERHTHHSGKDSVNHGKNGSDDYANAVCGVVQLLAGAGAYSAFDRLYRMNHGHEAWERWKRGEVLAAQNEHGDPHWLLLEHLRRCGAPGV
jgi:hypothetical protein